MATPTPNAAEVSADLGLFFGLWVGFFITTPLATMFIRLLTRGAHEGMSAMFTSPPFSGRKSLSSVTRSYLFSQSPWGFYMDLGQAAASVISCVFYMVVACEFSLPSVHAPSDEEQLHQQLLLQLNALNQGRASRVNASGSAPARDLLRPGHYSAAFSSFLQFADALVEPVWISDIEDVITVYFAVDFFVRLWLARDSLKWYFSLVSLLDFVTVAPMLTVWLMQMGNEYDTNVSQVVACIRVLRVARIFRVIRVIRSVGISSSYAFQRQVFVLVATVLCLVFVCAGIYQVFEEQEWERIKAAGVTPLPAQPIFHRSMYYATVSVIGRPVVPFISTLTAVFMTVTVCLAATIIPTFVAELIRLWFDAAAVETYTPNPEQPHVLVCGDTNVSRLRSLTSQYFHVSRHPDAVTPIVILAEAKPEGALRAFIDQYKHSGMLRYIRGSARRAPDLRRAGLGGASCAIVLNYRSDKDAAAADTEVLSTVMALKNVKPDIRVLAQLARPRKRNHLKAVPGWHDGDKSVASACLSMTLVGLGAGVPGLPTLVTNLIRRGTTLAGLRRVQGTVKGSTSSLLGVLYYGDRAKPAAAEAMAALMEREAAKNRAMTPLEEYASSIDQAIHEMPVTTGLTGRTFASAARAAYLRYGITLLGATVPINDDVVALMPGLPRTYKVSLFPSNVVLARGMRLYLISNDPDDIERFRLETGGLHKGVLAKVVEGVTDRVSSVTAVFKPRRLEEGVDQVEVGSGGSPPTSTSSEAVWAPGPRGGGGGDFDPFATDARADVGAADGASAAPANTGTAWLHGGHASFTEASYRHNRVAATDVSVPWCFHETETTGGTHGEVLAELLERLHVPLSLLPGGHAGPSHSGGAESLRETLDSICSFCSAAAAASTSGGGDISSSSTSTAASVAAAAAGGAALSTRSSLLASGALLTGNGVVNLSDKSEEEEEEVDAHNGSLSLSSSSSVGDLQAPISSVSSPSSSSSSSAVAPDTSNLQLGFTSSTSSDAAGAPPPTSTSSTADELVVAVISSAAVAARRQSFGDDGLGGIDDTDDVTGNTGPLATTAPSIHHAGGIAVTALAAAKANMNSLAVRLALPVAAAGTDVEGMAAEAKYKAPAYSGHILVCGASDAMGYLLRAVASQLTHANRMKAQQQQQQQQRRRRDTGRGASSSTASTTAGGATAADSAAAGVGTEAATSKAATAQGSSDAVATKSSADWVEGEQYDLGPADVVVMAASKPSDANLNAMYAGSSRLLSRCTFLTGSPSEASDLLRAGVMTARAAVILTSSKPAASADGSDNLSDDTDAIVTASTIYKLNPSLHLITELLHGVHAPFLRPTGATLNDAQRSSFVWILEEREAVRQRARLEDAIRRLALTTTSTSFNASSRSIPLRASVLLTKLSKQQLRLKASSSAFTRRLTTTAGAAGGAAAGTDALVPSKQPHGSGTSAAPPHTHSFRSTMEQLDATAGTTTSGARSGRTGARPQSSTEAIESSDADLERLAASGLSNAAIVDVLVGVREEFGASAAANEGAAFSMGGSGAGAAAGASKGSGATNDLFASPAFAAGRVFSFNTMDSLMLESHFAPFIPTVLKQLTRAARKQRLVVLPVTEAIVMAQVALTAAAATAPFSATANAHAGVDVTDASSLNFNLGTGAEAVRRSLHNEIRAARETYLSHLAVGIMSAARGGQPHAHSGNGGGASADGYVPVETYGQLVEALIRVWNVLPLGLYRRVHPATGLKASPQTVAALQLAAGPPVRGEETQHNRALISYVFSNPPPHTRLAEHDLVYILRPDEVEVGDE